MPVDLDSIQYVAERVIPDSEIPARVWLARPVVLALVAELRAARAILADLADQLPEIFDEEGGESCRFCATRSYERDELAHHSACVWLRANRLHDKAIGGRS